MAGYVYILKCSNGRYYIGSTSDIVRRFAEHSHGQSKATQNLLPVELVFEKFYPSLVEARKIERKLKAWKSKVLIDRIISDQDILAD